MLVVVTGPVRSGKSSVGLQLAQDSGRPIVVLVGAREDDEEMRRRIARHRQERPDSVGVLEVADPAWRTRVSAEVCLLVDCLGSVLARELWTTVDDERDVATAEDEDGAEARADELVDYLLAREAPTVVVTNEVGWGVVPAFPAGRLFRDVLGRANKRLVSAADSSWLVVDGRCVEMTSLPMEVSWPKKL